VVVLHGHVRSMEAVLRFGCERGLGCDGEKGSHWALEEEDLLASANSHCSHVLVWDRDRGRRTTEIVNGVGAGAGAGAGAGEGYSDAGHERGVLALLHTFRDYQQHQYSRYWRLHLHWRLHYWH
jgi:hypothetical protein